MIRKSIMAVSHAVLAVPNPLRAQRCPLPAMQQNKGNAALVSCVVAAQISHKDISLIAAATSRPR